MFRWLTPNLEAGRKASPRFVLRLRLGLLQQTIGQLERRLAGEYPTLDMEPLLREHATLLTQRDALIEALADNA